MERERERERERESTLLESGLLCNANNNSSLPSTSSSPLIDRKQSDRGVIVQRTKMAYSNPFKQFLANLHEVFLGTKLFPLFSAVPLAIAAHAFHLGSAWVFALSLIGLAPLAERVSFLSESVAKCITKILLHAVGGLLNATCGNAPELVLALLALHDDKIEVLKWSLLGSILSNLLLVLGSSLLCGGLFNMGKERAFDRKQADVSLSLMFLGLLCHVMTLIYKYNTSYGESMSVSGTELVFSRLCGILMVVAYAGCLFFQLKTHRQLFLAQDEDGSDGEDGFVIGFVSAIIWLLGMTIVIAILSEYIVSTIEAVSETWDIPVRFICVILLPIAGNATEHASAIIFAFKNKIDITLGVTLGSASQISMFVMPLTLIVAWVKGVNMGLDFSLLETASLVMAIFITAFTLQVLYLQIFYR
ncbi:vacuolar cation/proton exchanger 1a-like protein [Carex littledalei]|uniref:Vacuolar cation/proton exchanger n=1 Tax=Carex littledalei TaxID=544730 RepID=A0A833QZP1_9POAL|nr:vacuolar cation/proton exchanger 1a-like protein [Carex littledalei]